LQIGIGDLIISFSSSRGQIPEVYNNFLLNNIAPDLILEFHYGKIPNFPVDEKIFDSDTVWSCYKSGGKYIFKNRPLTTTDSPDLMISIEPAFDSGDIYASRPDLFPFQYPLGEIITINLLSRNHGILAHACGIDDNNHGYLFLGNSTHGKSTIAKLWSENGAIILNDDRVIVREKDGQFWMYGTPWHGTFDKVSPKALPIRKIFFLRHDEENCAIRKKGAEAVSMLLTRSFPPLWDNKGMDYTLGLLDRMASKLPCYELHFLPNKKIIDFVRNF
jgi:hypothetical protein